MSSTCTIIQKCVAPATITEGHSVPPHPNIALRERQGTCEVGHERDQEDYHTICDLTDDIKTYFTRTEKDWQNCAHQKFRWKLGNAEVKTILIQLGHAVLHFHVNNLPHGDICVKNVLFSQNGDKVVLTHPTAVFKKQSELTTENSKEQDVKSLAKVYSFLIETAKGQGAFECSDDHIKDDLLSQMDSGKMSAVEVLQHPFLWCTHKQISLQCAVSRMCKSQTHNKLKTSLNEKSDEVLGGNSWKEKLTIEAEELDRYQQILKDKFPDDDRKIRKDTFENVAFKRCGNKAEQYKRIHPLLNFIRNRFEHMGEDINQVQACYSFDSENGFWNFFAPRFPKLFGVMYEVAKEYSTIQSDTELSSIFFSHIEENRLLPFH